MSTGLTGYKVVGGPGLVHCHDMAEVDAPSVLVTSTDEAGLCDGWTGEL
jgi:hypothetical protein